MFALIALLLLGGPETIGASTTQPLLVFVPEDSTPAGCFATEHVAAVIALTPSLRLIRGAIKDQETLEDARARYAADLAIDGTRKVLATGNEEVSLRLARSGKAVDAKTSSGKPTEHTGAALRAIWPADLPKLTDAGAPAAANAEALEAACAKDAARAYAASGAAIGPLVRLQLAQPAPEGKTLFARWAKAESLERAGKCKDAVPILRALVASLSKNEWGPVWRRAARENAAPSELDLFNGTLIAFENGTFSALDTKTGVDRWRLEVGPSTPHLTDATGGLVLAALSGEIAAIDLEDGRIRWRVPLKAPSPEIAQMGGRIFVAGEENVLALDRSKGDVVWRFDPLSDMIAGPTVAGSNLAVAAESAVLLLDPQKGTTVKKIQLGDEISAPLTVTAQGSIWAMVGSDQIVNLDPSTSEVRLRALDLPGAEWPPALASEQLVVVMRKKNKPRAIAYLDVSAKNGLKRSFLGAPPVLELPSFAGVVYVEERPPAIVARDLEGGVLWKITDRQKITQLSREGDLIIAAVGSRARILEPKKGATVAELDFGEPVKQIVLGERGGAALVESGVIYGFPSPSDVRPKVWLRDARMELGDCFLILNQGANAAATAKQILERDPDDLDARAMFAAAEEKTKPREAAERWLQLATVASKNDPLQADAERALHALAGIDGSIFAAPPPEPKRLEKFKMADGEELAVAGASPDYVVMLDQSSTAHVVRASNGERVWMLPLGETVSAASISGDRVLFSTDKRLLGVDAETGKEVFSVPVIAGDVQKLVTTANGWIVASKQKLRVIERSKGKVLALLPFASPLLFLAAGEKSAIAAFEDETIAAIDFSRGTIEGRLKTGAVKRLYAADGKIYVVLESGLLLAIDPAQKLRPL